MHATWPFGLLKLSQENWILPCVGEDFPEYKSGITIQASIIVYLNLQHFPWFKN